MVAFDCSIHHRIYLKRADRQKPFDLLAMAERKQYNRDVRDSVRTSGNRPGSGHGTNQTDATQPPGTPPASCVRPTRFSRVRAARSTSLVAVGSQQGSSVVGDSYQQEYNRSLAREQHWTGSKKTRAAVMPSLRTCNEGLLRPRVARAQEHDSRPRRTLSELLTSRTLFSTAARSRPWRPSDRAHRCPRRTCHR